MAYYDESKRLISLGNRLGKGGEAGVYAVPGTNNAAKIYSGLSPADVAQKHAKVKAMLSLRPQDPTAQQNHVSIAWPRRLLFDSSGIFAGFLMPSVAAIGTLKDVNSPAARALNGLSGFSGLYLHRAASNLCHAVGAIHDVGHVIGDLNPNNVLVNEKSLVTLIDTDSYQITDPSNGMVFPCGVGVAEYLAPERARGSGTLTSEQDSFTVAILVFELVMGGFHPYAGGGIVSVQSTAQLTTCEYLKQGLFPFAKNAFAAPPNGAPDFQLLHHELRDAFVRAFLYGHAAPNLRPTPKQWATLVSTAEKDLEQCSRNAAHFYYRSVRTCLWCEQERRLNQPTGTQKAMPVAAPIHVSPPHAAPAHATPPPPVVPAPAPQPPPGLQPVSSSSPLGPGTFIAAVLLLGLLAWLISSAVRQGDQTSPPTSVQPAAVIASTPPQQPHTETPASSSGDGWLAYSSDRDTGQHGRHQIYVIRSDGTAVRRLTNSIGDEGSPVWSADGRAIAFASTREGGNSHIFLMNADGTNQRLLVSSSGVDTPSSFSPDGTKLAFVSNRDGNNEIYVADTDGNNVQRLTNNSADDQDPLFSPNGSQIAFISNRDSGDFDIYVMNADGTNPTRLTSGEGRSVVTSWSPDGRKLAYHAGHNGTFQVWTMNADGSNKIRLTNAANDNSEPSWSPDGNRIAFLSAREHAWLYNVWVMNADGSNQHAVEHEPGQHYSVRWAPSVDAASRAAARAESTAPSSTSTQTTPATVPSDDENTAVALNTSAGEIDIEFFPKQAPNHVRNFLALAARGFYNGTKFHRVIPGFIVQGGDPNSIRGEPSTWGQGGSGETLAPEFNDIHHARGIVSMARASDPRSASSQFFICLADAPYLDHQYTVFGRVVKGMDVVDAIASGPRTAGDRPQQPVVIDSINVRHSSAADTEPPTRGSRPIESPNTRTELSTSGKPSETTNLRSEPVISSDVMPATPQKSSSLNERTAKTLQATPEPQPSNSGSAPHRTDTADAVAKPPVVNEIKEIAADSKAYQPRALQPLAAFAGQWHGDVSQRGARPYKVLFSVVAESEPGRLIGEIQYPEVQCGGKLRLLQASPGYFKAAEILMWGLRNCVGGGTVTVHLTANNKADWSWSDGIPRDNATATVYRQ